MPPLSKVHKASTNWWFQSLRIKGFCFKDEDVFFLTQLYTGSMQGENDFCLEFVDVKLTVDGREYMENDMLTFLSEKTSANRGGG
jgi:hypothetical protein